VVPACHEVPLINDDHDYPYAFLTYCWGEDRPLGASTGPGHRLIPQVKVRPSFHHDEMIGMHEQGDRGSCHRARTSLRRDDGDSIGHDS